MLSHANNRNQKGAKAITHEPIDNPHGLGLDPINHRDPFGKVLRRRQGNTVVIAGSRSHDVEELIRLSK